LYGLFLKELGLLDPIAKVTKKTKSIACRSDPSLGVQRGHGSDHFLGVPRIE
jgi:hypothetical protein